LFHPVSVLSNSLGDSDPAIAGRNDAASMLVRTAWRVFKLTSFVHSWLKYERPSGHKLPNPYNLCPLWLKKKKKPRHPGRYLLADELQIRNIEQEIRNEEVSSHSSSIPGSGSQSQVSVSSGIGIEQFAGRFRSGG
jgi:hypothetical protein